MESLTNIQEATMAAIVKARSNFKKSPKERLTLIYIESRLENLEQQWQLFFKTHVDIIGKKGYHESEYNINNVFDRAEDIYLEFKSDLKEKIASLKLHKEKFSVEASQSQNTNVKLPEIKIPMFSGKYLEWRTFRDLFQGLVHNNKCIDDAQKLYYLKSHLTGDAEQLLRNVPVTSDNYLNSWKKLESMYNNKRYLANNILNTLLNQKKLYNESAIDIKKLVSTTTDCLESIKTLGIDVSSWDILVIHIICSKLDKDTRKDWELSLSSDSTDNLPTYRQFTDFLVGRFRCLENLDGRNVERGPKHSQTFHLHKEKKDLSCLYCSSNHKISQCQKFCSKPNQARRDFAQTRGLCFVCLYDNHSAKACKSNFKCHICKKRHHTLLHPSGVSQSGGENSSTGDQAATSAEEAIDQAVVSCMATRNCGETVLLTTALVKTKANDGTYRVMRALLDQGSQGSFITESMVQYLGLTKKAMSHTITGVGGGNTLLSKSTVKLELQSRLDPEFKITIDTYVLKNITSLLPSVKAKAVTWLNLDLADPDYNKPNKIDVLLGAEVYSQVIKVGIKRSADGRLLAQDSALGWIISGVVETASPSTQKTTNIAVMHSSIGTDDLLKKFWELEDEPTLTKKILTEEEVRCENLFSATTRRDENGRYVVRLPFKDGNRSCLDGGSRDIAERRFKGLESKFNKNSKLKEDYTKVIQEYADLSHMVKVPEKSNKKGLYLPHHAVVREDKETTKVRVVFDASCKGRNGLSLNDNLMVGPTLQGDLRHTIMRWRRHSICIAADIVKMYRQVLVDREDTCFQRILWRDNPQKKIEEHELVTVTFGTASAPYLAVRVLQQIAHDEAQNYPQIKDIILNDFYIDDLMTGAENIEEGYKIYREISSILAKGGFKLQKWISNNKEVINKIKKEERKDSMNDVKIQMDKLTKILGLTWDPNADVFQYSVALPVLEEPVTKRRMISDISKLFDPLGWLAPSIIVAKIMIQKLWLSGIGWDQTVPSNLLKEWLTYRDDLVALAEVKIPRWMFRKSDDGGVELHGFSDASKMAYAAVVYLRTIDSNGKIHVALVTAKTKVAPIKQVSVPRLELCGATLLTKLMMEVANVLSIAKEDLYAWTDSEIVLAWLNSHPSRWKTFVANRVSEILTNLDTKHWSHVPSKQNPADIASRGVSSSELGGTSIWFNGPEFLKEESIVSKKSKHLATQLEEVKSLICTEDCTLWQKYSSLSRLVRVVAYCRRFLNLIKTTTKRNDTRYLSVEELGEAMDVCIKKSQEEDFSHIIEDLKRKGNLDKKEKCLKSLNLFLDADGMVRVGGRLEASQMEYSRKHPILLSKTSFLTKLLVADSHTKTMHGGPQTMIAYIRTKFHILGVKSTVKSYYRQCVTCIRYSTKMRAQLMGQLPSSRVTPSRPFSISGVDYAGPINIRVSKGRGNKSYKGYIALFVCMSTRAIHLEAVTELTSKGFLSAFKRFVSRRGHCVELHSDNGTNFVGAARELSELFDRERSTFLPELAEYLANNGTKWSFIPPHAPNFGGLWEAGVKSTKHHLRRVIGNSTLTFEEMSTVLAQIEAVLNSRPLSYVENNDEGLVLSPGHFLVGEPLVVVPDINYEQSNINSLKRWQLTQRMLQNFWRHWSQDYLNQFLQRYKWVYQTPEPNVGDVVLIKEDDMPPGRWLLGKIEIKHPGPDQITRVVSIRTKNTTIKRPVSRVCVLPISQ